MARIIDITMEINGVEYPATIEFEHKAIHPEFYNQDGHKEFKFKVLKIKSEFLDYDVSFLISGARKDIIKQLKNMEWR